MPLVLDIHEAHFNKNGEELCGDTVKIRRSPQRSIVVLSDGLGSGVKANILATLTAQILVKMLGEDVALDEVIATVIGTLPVCKVRGIAYATFSVLQVDHAAQRFQIVNFDNPAPIFLRDRKLVVLPKQTRRVLDREVAFAEGGLQAGDCLALLSDGVLHAGIGTTMNLGWGWERVARFVEETARLHGTQEVVRQVMSKVWSLYGGKVGDDATLVGMGLRPRRSVAVMTGPPLKREDDRRFVEALLGFEGRKVVCGGTTGNIVAGYLKQTPQMEMATMRPTIPPAAQMPGVELMTEGMLTMSRALELLRGAGLKAGALPEDDNAAVRLAREVAGADHVHFVVGQRINEFYQNPDLPANLSLRKNLINEYVQVLKEGGREVTVEYF